MTEKSFKDYLIRSTGPEKGNFSESQQSRQKAAQEQSRPVAGEADIRRINSDRARWEQALKNSNPKPTGSSEEK